MAESADCIVVGAGVVGLAVARAFAAYGREVLVLEAERTIGTGVSSRSSEVIHAGIYYLPHSLKARLCVSGRDQLYEYCNTRNVEHRRLGKLIVATSEPQVLDLHRYADQAAANGVADLRLLTGQEVRSIEPSVRCVAGLLSPSTGIIDSHGLMIAYQADIEAHGGTILFNTRVLRGTLFSSGVQLEIEGGTSVSAGTVVNAGGLQAQALSSRMEGIPHASIPDLHLAKGHYFTLSGRSPFKRLVYPIANEAGLGTHVTLDLSGRARFGPDVQWIDHVDYTFNTDRRALFCRAIREYYPDLDESCLQPGYVGIRPKVCGPGQPSADFCICGPAAHGGAPYAALYGIESPGLTASLALGTYVARMFEQA
ncbi:NAD(P)/FAD-dependent oxidoreductase [Steroidobacter sp. S1-65]|uniref:NAD(P)/FAD-dependent oxidoreductase n=1 Tax=Steroidobacter gossypii TaxID=2805490 RepID=A0ABS1X6Q6_9GAMM|nr:NAD(P)/FAD-dependent oxidoreductase [Steroidobacter gossypii]MBM0108909.1 NAD(P)/FAD-dependent oxidoreductase [Steroidobacter gossypii]